MSLTSCRPPTRGYSGSNTIHRRLPTGEVAAPLVAVTATVMGTAACKLPLSSAVLSAAALDRYDSASTPPVGGASPCKVPKHTDFALNLISGHEEGKKPDVAGAEMRQALLVDRPF